VRDARPGDGALRAAGERRKLEAMLLKNHRDDKEARFEKKKKESVGVDNRREDFERTKRKNTEEMLAEMRRVASSKS